MLLVHYRGVVIVLIIINISFCPVESRPNDQRLHTARGRQKRKYDVNTKWFQQSRAPRKSLFSQDNGSDGNNTMNDETRHRGLYKRKIHGIEDTDFGSSVEDRGDQGSPEIKRAPESRPWSDIKDRSKTDKSEVGEKTIQLDHFLSLTNTNRFKLVASFQNIKMKDPILYSGSTNTSLSGSTKSKFPMAFNISLPEHVMSIDQSKLNLYLRHTNEHFPCLCKLQIQVLFDPAPTNTRMIAHDINVTRSAWHSVDFTDLVDETQTSGLFFLNLSINCARSDENEILNLHPDATRFPSNQCGPNILWGTDFYKDPILTLFTLKNEKRDEKSIYDYHQSQSGRKDSFDVSSSPTKYYSTTERDQRWRPLSKTQPSRTDFQKIRSEDRSLNITQNFEKTAPTAKLRLKRRARRRRGGRNSCRRKALYVDFETMKWADFILYPRGYEAFHCVGRCYSPISNYLTPTFHAIIQNLVHMSHPRKTSRVCCVPTKLDSLPILFHDSDNNLENRNLKEMVVKECGCR